MTLQDVPHAAPLMADLGYPTDASALADRLAAVYANADDAVFVAELDDKLVGLIGCHSFEMLHRPGRLGRITALVVADMARGRGIGRQLVGAAEAHLLAQGCIRLEVTSAEHRGGAHRFYVSLGYAEQRVRFVKIPVAASPA
jgi:GNAT superfamily N-acetyltransferase